jgi:hypothetical protein
MTTALRLITNHVALACVIAFGALVWTVPAMAQTVNVDVQVIVASNDGAGVERALQPMQTNLTRQFSLFDSFRLASSHALILRVGETREVPLPGGGVATLEVVSLRDGAATIRIGIPGGSSTITTHGGLVFVGGSRAPDGRIILAITT